MFYTILFINIFRLIFLKELTWKMLICIWFYQSFFFLLIGNTLHMLLPYKHFFAKEGERLILKKKIFYIKNFYVEIHTYIRLYRMYVSVKFVQSFKLMFIYSTSEYCVNNLSEYA